MPARRLLTSTLLIATLGVGVAACSSSGSNGAASDRSDPSGAPTTTGAQVAGTGVVNAPSGGSDDGANPCDIVSAADVQAILGTTAKPSGPTSQNRGHQCTWDPGNGASVLVQVFQGKEFYDPSMQAPSAKKLSGIGDAAYLDDFGTTRSAVGFLKGDIAVFIDGFQITGSAAVVAAARDAVSNV